MELRILSPSKERVCQIEWLEINTPAGNLVIQDNHAPLIANITHNSMVKLFTDNTVEEIMVSVGSIKIYNNIVTLLMHDSQSL